jgi:hypothetical protein
MQGRPSKLRDGLPPVPGGSQHRARRFRRGAVASGRLRYRYRRSLSRWGLRLRLQTECFEERGSFSPTACGDLKQPCTAVTQARVHYYNTIAGGDYFGLLPTAPDGPAPQRGTGAAVANGIAPSAVAASLRSPQCLRQRSWMDGLCVCCNLHGLRTGATRRLRLDRGPV